MISVEGVEIYGREIVGLLLDDKTRAAYLAYNKAIDLHEKGSLDLAIAEYCKCLEFKPWLEKAKFNLEVAYSQKEGKVQDRKTHTPGP